eukprot:11832607-Alexandrium_andersonii.AAC.1
MRPRPSTTRSAARSSCATRPSRSRSGSLRGSASGARTSAPRGRCWGRRRRPSGRRSIGPAAGRRLGRSARP